MGTPAKTGAVVSEVLDAFNDLSDPERIEKSKTYFPTAMRVAGVSNPDIKSVIREVRKKYSDWMEQDWIQFCKSLVGKGIFECQVMAFEILGRDKKLLSTLNYGDLQSHLGGSY